MRANPSRPGDRGGHSLCTTCRPNRAGPQYAEAVRLPSLKQTLFIVACLSVHREPRLPARLRQTTNRLQRQLDGCGSTKQNEGAGFFE